MVERGLNLLLLPGMDGTGELFADFVKLLPGYITSCTVSYPRDRKLTYDRLLPVVKSALPSDEPFVILAESFSTPLAVSIAAETPKDLLAVVLCAGFVSPPRRDVLSSIVSLLAPALFAIELPSSVCRSLLVGENAPPELVNRVSSIVSSVSPAVMTHRFRSALSCNCKQELRRVSVPLLYIAGTEDRLVKRTSFTVIKEAKPDSRFVTIDAPHLVLQAKPHESVDVVLEFLQEVGTKTSRAIIPE
jgi:pimeloyl-[acyl-carrier protein] methyl ester esterase